jgi:hypothetical protein
VVRGDDVEALQLEDEPQHLAEPTVVVDDGLEATVPTPVSPFDSSTDL